MNLVNLVKNIENIDEDAIIFQEDKENPTFFHTLKRVKED